ncbi:hypothetical protein [Pseudomonas syringae]|uniref:hypothetical protein n=1 Tax=Pseudomonas syringae TaxID=317 RepID=UPI001F1F8FF9|nr:hypothetical protein [Pseudomonas syringae]MCF5371351.1 hypothetical protein [Pseudomonas syringae]
MTQNQQTQAALEVASATQVTAYVPIPNPRMSFEVVKYLASENTFSLFQKHGKINLEWLMPTEYQTRDMSIPECLAMLGNMRAWLQTASAASEAESVGSDLRFVLEKLEHVEGTLSAQSKYHGVMFLKSGNDDRQAREDDARADAYCHALYSSSPYDEYDSLPKSNWFDDDLYMTFDETLEVNLEIMAEKAKDEINLLCAQALIRIESYPVTLFQQ